MLRVGTLLAAILCCTAFGRAAEPVFSSKTVSQGTPGHAVEIKADVSGAKRLYLVVTDAGDGFSCDWADWVEPRLVSKDGERTKKLTDLKWKSAQVGWGQPRVNRNAGGGPLKVGGKPVEYGIGVHANSVLTYDLPDGFARFEARGGLDAGGTSQGCGSTVRFQVYTEKPPARVLAASRGGGGPQDAGLRSAEDALSGLEVHEDLQAEVFAAEPLLANPTNMDIDAEGRVWVCEVINYRRFRNKDHPERKEGDRILVLEDTNGDGKADRETTFYQGRDIDSAHGVCVLAAPDGKGTQAIVSAGDSVFVFTDEDGDLKADEKEVLFTGISGTQHDHGIHAFVFGPDGKLYFNFGNAGKQLKDADGKPVIDQAGNVVAANRKPYQEGMVFRCNLDGSDVETLGWNFRNNWEVAVDSFGTIWQSDNDDDGNRGVRINYVMEFGNYGYKDERTGAGWKSARTGMHAEVPKRHWHLNDPGVVPNLLQTGAGSPTGICVYEGELLPEVFRDEVVHCDAGPNVVRAYPVERDGAGYDATIVNVLEGVRDKWFRPSGVCVAPDGSVFVCDWYDPGVGGHRMGDVERGRIFRITPEGHEGYEVPEQDFSTAKGAAEALKSPNEATRYIAWTALHGMGAKAKPALQDSWQGDDARIRARALWLLTKLDEQTARESIASAVEDGNPDIRITALRAARQTDAENLLVETIHELVHDESPAVRRECAIALRELDDEPLVATLWTQLALQHEAGDRWYLEALGIAARGRWDRCIAEWLTKVGEDYDSPAGRDVLWRSRSQFTPQALAEFILDAESAEGRLRYFRAFDFQPDSKEKNEALLSLVLAGHEDQAEITALALEHGAKVDPQDPQTKKAIDEALAAVEGTPQFVELIASLKLEDRYDDLLKLAQEHPADTLGVRAMSVLLNANRKALIEQAVTGEDSEAATATLEAIGNTGSGKAIGYLLPLLDDEDRPLERRRAAAAALGKLRNGATKLIELTKKDQLDEQLAQTVAATLHAAPWPEVKTEALKLFPPPPSKNQKPLPPLAELVQRKGDWKKGRLLFHSTATCHKCHQVNGFGKEVGPDLSEIGKKLSREALYQSILYPSAGISHNYETWVLVLSSGNVVNGVITSRTDDSVTIKGPDAIAKTFATSEIDAMRKQSISLMPADLQKTMTEQDLIDVVEYMTTLKKARPNAEPPPGAGSEVPESE